MVKKLKCDNRTKICVVVHRLAVCLFDHRFEGQLLFCKNDATIWGKTWPIAMVKSSIWDGNDVFKVDTDINVSRVSCLENCLT